MKRILSIVISAVIATAPAFCPAAEEVTRDGVLYVVNDETPAGKSRIEPEELWRRGDEEDEILFGSVGSVVTDPAGNFYVLDSQLSEIVVLSPEGDYLRTIGREGEGPGEFRDALDMYLDTGGILGVVCVFPGKVVRLSTEGIPADNFPLPNDDGGGFQLVYRGSARAGQVLLSGAKQERDGAEQVQVAYLKAFDARGNELATFHEETYGTRYGGMKFEEPKFSNFTRRWTEARDGRVAAALDFDAYRIHVWKPDGTIDRVIERPGFTPLERTGEEKERFQKFYDGITRWNPNSSFEISPTHLTVSRMWFQDDGSLWVMSSRGMYEPGDGVFASIDVFDREGSYVNRVELALEGNALDDGVWILGDRMVVVTDLLSAVMAQLGGDVEGADDGAEPLQVIAYSIGGAGLGMR
jgi:hypothetical protein